MQCAEKDIFLKTLVKVNQRAGVDPEVIDLIKAFAGLRLARNRTVDFYAASGATLPGGTFIHDFIRKNNHLDQRIQDFLTAYYQEMKDSHLCCIFSCAHLAHLLQTSLPRLFSLARDRRGNYHIFSIKKSNGTDRLIQAPNRELKSIQRNILDTIMAQIPLNNHAEGFRRKRSILTNATRHVNKKVVIKLDIKDFFPSISFKRIRGMYIQLGYPQQVATLLSSLVTHQGRLPTGAPTSPVIANIISRKLDNRFVNLGLKANFSYSRYADDMTFSGNDDTIVRMIPFFKEIVRDEGFIVNERKIRILRSGGRQTVTGVVVNQKPNITRKEIRKIRAVVHNCKHGRLQQQASLWGRREKGLPHTHRYSVTDLHRALQAKIHFIKMINTTAGEKLLAEFKSITWPG